MGNPDVSVILATYNRAEALRRTLCALCGLDTGGLSWQVVVADNHAAGSAREVCAAFAERLPIRYVLEPLRGKNRAIAAALGAADGDLVVMTDDDVQPCREWLVALVRAAGAWPEISIFCGPVTTEVPRAFAGTLAGAVPTCNFRHARGGILPADALPIGANLAFRRRVLRGRERALFDPAIGPRGSSRISGSETVALKALRRAGEQIVYVPEAHVLHETPAGFRSAGGLCKRAFAQGRGDVRVLDFGGRCPRLLGVPRFLVRALAGDLAAALAAAASLRRKKALHAIFHAARTLGSIVEWRRRRHGRDAGDAGDVVSGQEKVSPVSRASLRIPEGR